MIAKPVSRRALMLAGFAIPLIACSAGNGEAEGAQAPDPAEAAFANSRWRRMSDTQWRERLPDLAYRVLRQEYTEHPYTSPLNDEHREGVFHCLGCDLPLFRSEWKFDSGTGWPSFYRAIDGALGEKTDYALNYPRTEYHCAQCLGHHGHRFNDGPRPTGLRYCNNGAALRFEAA